MVIARVMPRVALGTAGSSGSPEAEDAVAMAAFTTLSHELISACKGRGKTPGHLEAVLLADVARAQRGRVRKEAEMPAPCSLP